MSAEVRITDPKTGGQKGQKDAQLGTLDPRALMEVAKVGGFGAKKYARYNFAKGYAWSLSYDALQRHLNAFWDRQDRDEESGLYHLAHAAWHCLALLTFVLRGRGTDDRLDVPAPEAAWPETAGCSWCESHGDSKGTFVDETSGEKEPCCMCNYSAFTKHREP